MRVMTVPAVLIVMLLMMSLMTAQPMRRTRRAVFNLIPNMDEQENLVVEVMGRQVLVLGGQKRGKGRRKRINRKNRARQAFRQWLARTREEQKVQEHVQN